MIRRIVPALAVLSLLVVLSAPSAAPAEQKDAQPGQRGHKLHKKIEVEIKLNYLLFLPQDYGKEQGRKWPVIMFLHGAGERGDDLEKAKKHGIPRVVEEGTVKEFPFIAVSPQCPAESWWTYQLEALSGLPDEIERTYRVDPDRVYLTGLSMGGFGTFAHAVTEPQRFAAIVPICGGGESIGTRRITHLPTWVFHGAKDEVVPLCHCAAPQRWSKRWPVPAAAPASPCTRMPSTTPGRTPTTTLISTAGSSRTCAARRQGASASS